MLNKTKIPRRLIEAIKKDELIIFVGAGLSKKLGLPDWNELTKIIINKLSEDNPVYKNYLEFLDSQMMTAIEILNKLENNHRREIYEILLEKLKLPEKIDLLLHKKILELSPKIITTNYDKAFERAVGLEANVIPYKSDFKVSTLSSANNYIFKIHGCIDYVDSCILFESQYKNHYETTKASSFEIEKIFSEKKYYSLDLA